MAAWQVVLKDVAGATAARFVLSAEGGVESLTAMNRVNCVGAFSLLLPKAADESVATFLARMALFELDGQVELWRRDAANGVDWYLVHEGLVRGRRFYVTAPTAMVCEITGRGYTDLLTRRIIEAAAGSDGAVKSGAAETVIKEFVDEQAGPSAGTRALTGLSVEADSAKGNTVNISAPYKGLYETCRDVAAVGGGDFAIVGVGDALFEFRWYNGQLGTDRTATVRFSYELGNMATPEVALLRQDEVSAVLVAGQGEGSARVTEWRTDATRIALSTWNRIERYMDARDVGAQAGLQARGDAALEDGTPRNALSFTPAQLPSCAFDVHYFLGDKVSAAFLGHEATKRVMQATYSVNAQGEKVTVGLEDA